MENNQNLPTSEAEYVSALRERVKELGCLYRIADIATKPGLALEEILQQVVELLPPSMQYPSMACSRLMIDGIYYCSSDFHISKLRISANIVVEYQPRGFIEIYYPDIKSPESLIAFLPEEEQLLKTIAHQISLVIERKSIEETNARLQEQLRHADRLATIGQLSAGIAHELNEPLSTILGFAQLIAADKSVNGECATDLQKIVNATLHAREVVRKLMLFSRQMPPKKERIDLNKLIEEGFYFLENRCSRQSINIVRDLDSDVPCIVADPGQMHQVLVNLTVNAMQAMPGGGTITIKTRKKKHNLEFSVTDDGQGMSADLIEKIFIPFFTTKEIDQGTGLGLSVVHGIVTSHNGKINVQSKPGQGSTFTVVLPINDNRESNEQTSDSHNGSHK